MKSLSIRLLHRVCMPAAALLMAPAVLFSQTTQTEGLPPVPPDAASAEEVAPGAEAEEGLEVLTRGPLHEAFASPVDQDPQPGALVEAEPPEPIQELPPEVKPDGENVEWIPGYWAWDEEQERYIWISGVWRTVPPGREWVPGYWNQEADGHRWVSGYWGAATPSGSQVAESVYRAAQEAQAYVAPPPESLDVGPTSPQPSDQHFWVPGCWIYADAGYRWQPGYWYEYQPNWVWVPNHYVWTPAGCLFVPGYWDYTLQARGMVFAPVYFTRPIYTRPHYYYRPHYALQVAHLALHLFVHPRHRYYWYGDYYGPHYAGLGYRPWFQFSYFSGGYFDGYPRYYNPLLAYYGVHFRRHGIDYIDRLRGWHRYYDHHAEHRPPRKHHHHHGGRGVGRDHEHSPHRHVLARSVDEVRREDHGSGGRRVVDIDRTERTQEQLRRRVDAAREVARARQVMEREADRPRVVVDQDRNPRRGIVRNESDRGDRINDSIPEARREQFRRALERSREVARDARQEEDRPRSRVRVPDAQERALPAIVRGQQPNRSVDRGRSDENPARQRVLRIDPPQRREASDVTPQARDLARERLRNRQQQPASRDARPEVRAEGRSSITVDRARQAMEAAREAQQSILARQRSAEVLRERQRLQSSQPRGPSSISPGFSGRGEVRRSAPAIIERGRESATPRPQIERFQRPTPRVTPQQAAPRQIDRARSFARERAQVQSRSVERALPQARSNARANLWRGGQSSPGATMQRGPSVRIERATPSVGNRGNEGRGNSGRGGGRRGR